MESWFSHASGIIISTRVRQRAAAEVEQFQDLVEGGGVGGVRACRSGRSGPAAPSPKRSEASWDSRAFIQLRLPLTVLISPLCATKRYGWASGQLGKVFVEKREWTSAIAVAKRRSERSGKNGSSWPVVSMPL